jgi:hypothetical protein
MHKDINNSYASHESNLSSPFQQVEKFCQISADSLHGWVIIRKLTTAFHDLQSLSVEDNRLTHLTCSMDTTWLRKRLKYDLVLKRKQPFSSNSLKPKYALCMNSAQYSSVTGMKGSDLVTSGSFSSGQCTCGYPNSPIMCSKCLLNNSQCSGQHQLKRKDVTKILQSMLAHNCNCLAVQCCYSYSKSRIGPNIIHKI